MKRTTAVVLIVTGILIGTCVGVYLGIPSLTEQFVSRVSTAMGTYFHRDISWDEMRFHRHDRIEFFGVKVRREGASDSEPPMLVFDRIDLAFEPASILGGKLRLRSVHFEGPRAHLLRFEDGTDNYSDFKERLVAFLRDSDAVGEGKDSPFRHLARVLPLLTIEDAEVVLDSASSDGDLLSALHLRNGTLTARDEGMVEGEMRLRFEGSIDVDVLDTQMGFHGSFLYPEKDVDLTLHMKKHVELPIGAIEGIDRTLGVGGVEWRMGEDVISLTDVSVGGHQKDPTDTDDNTSVIHVERVDLALTDDVGAVPSMISGGSGDGDPAWIQRVFSKVKSISLVEPKIFVARYADNTTNFSDLTAKLSMRQIRPADEEPPMQARVPSSKKRIRRGTGEKVRDKLESLFKSTGSGVRAITNGFCEVAAAFPFDSVVVERGSIRYMDNVVFPEGFQGELQNFEMSVARGPDPSVVEFSVGFETAGVLQRGVNRLKGRVHLDTRDVQVTLGVEALELEPYASLFPSVFHMRPETVLRDTDLTLIYNHERGEALVEGALAVDDLAFHHHMVSNSPFTGMDISLNGKGQILFGEGERGYLETIQLADMVFKLGDVVSTFSASIERHKGTPKIKFEFHLPQTPSQIVVDSIPLELIPRLEGLQVDGSLAWDLNVDLDTADMESLDYVAKPNFEKFRVLSMGEHVNFDLVRGRFLQRVQEPDGAVYEFITGPGSKNWVSYYDISPWMISVIGTTEDGRFFRHSGFSVYNIKESIITNLEKGGFYRGASTITQQLVKNLYLTREKTLSRKLQEFFITWQMEQEFTKKDILALYFNVIEFGREVYGIRRAATHYFGRHPSELDLLDSLFIGSMIPNPKKYSFQFRPDEGVTEHWQKRLEYFGKEMLRRKKISQDQFNRLRPFQPYFRGQARVRKSDVLALDLNIAENPVGRFDEEAMIPAHELDEWELEQDKELGFAPEIAP